MTRFRGCIDIHSGKVKQIVGGTLKSDNDSDKVATNFVSDKPSSYYGNLYKENNIYGCHIIKLGSSIENDKVAELALRSWPNNFQIGGGINDSNCLEWLNKGAKQIIITSWLFPNNQFSMERLVRLHSLVGDKNKIVLDLSCRCKMNNKRDKEWHVAIQKWTIVTELKLSQELFVELSSFCSEFLIHAADVEGLCRGIDEGLVAQLGRWFSNPSLAGVGVVYAGGGRSIADLQTVERLSAGMVDLTFGSALDIFGGSLVRFSDCVEWNRAREPEDV
ncbi:1-(5-phosphoribosyl)-5- ((5-phosphoribosylamino)methylideneamino)imidazole-4-carboxamide isomerase HIS6 [Ascoidea rubescens DSM 1968]|uniref:1-(5-phosphoribosyl)-5-[(5-phosphoribosylamino)methylideneamino] imidazole-4-carboxamide isomerase n=1 Tax=Ascoidea rubescens DSM 1968 TaxID=1344418 RepID=A0A1D2VNR7_9ASCO|nr:phosphoribosylformimino-5-aminoimidazole carboxamide ribotide isomerase [Ascoidea rubescens DSM 1968]ODV63246.1 phosphoribosylformimino-5-aminoimidazole carboxamide ribotide isomerase [Ascoidea rubescens DSM 1968]